MSCLACPKTNSNLGTLGQTQAGKRRKARALGPYCSNNVALLFVFKKYLTMFYFKYLVENFQFSWRFCLLRWRVGDWVPKLSPAESCRLDIYHGSVTTYNKPLFSLPSGITEGRFGISKQVFTQPYVANLNVLRGEIGRRNTQIEVAILWMSFCCN